MNGPFNLPIPEIRHDPVDQYWGIKHPWIIDWKNFGSKRFTTEQEAVESLESWLRQARTQLIDKLHELNTLDYKIKKQHEQILESTQRLPGSRPAARRTRR